MGWDLFELLNIYTMSTGSLTINGNTSAVGLNLYTPNASITINGGGNTCPNFMGRLWANQITMTGLMGNKCGDGQGNVMAPSSNPFFCDAPEKCPPLQGPSVFDFVARSFSHASGY